MDVKGLKLYVFSHFLCFDEQERSRKTIDKWGQKQDMPSLTAVKHKNYLMAVGFVWKFLPPATKCSIQMTLFISAKFTLAHANIYNP